MTKRAGAGMFTAFTVIALSAAGCSSDDKPAATAVDRLFALAGDDAEQRARLYHNAQQDATVECMAAAGFTYTPEEFRRRSLVSDPAQLAILTADRAADIAYGVEAGAIFISEQSLSENERQLSAMDAASQVAYEQALYGDQDDPEGRPGGCLASAEVAVAEEFPDYMTASDMASASALLENFIASFQQDTEAVWVDWSSCMSGAGFEFPTTFDAREDVERRFAGGELELDNGELHEYEFRVAMADAECQEPYLATLRTANAQAQDDVFGHVVGTADSD